MFPEIYRAEILIMEITFVAPSSRPAIHKFGHTHLDESVERPTVRERGHHRVALQYAAASRTDPADHRTAAAGVPARPAEGLALTRRGAASFYDFGWISSLNE